MVYGLGLFTVCNARDGPVTAYLCFVLLVLASGGTRVGWDNGLLSIFGSGIATVYYMNLAIGK